MKYRRKGAFAVAMAGVIALAGCGGDSAGPVTVDHAKDQKLMDAMGGYMAKRKTGGKASAKARPASASVPSGEPKPAP